MGSLSIQPEYEYAADVYDQGEEISPETTPHLSLVPIESRLRSWQYAGVKRGIDITLSTLMILICLIPGLLIAVVIALTSRGPIFYREVRVGRNGKPFHIWKFRSMKQKAAHHSRLDSVLYLKFHSRWRTDKDLHDPRITTVGHFLRRWSLDELPQLMNVLSGDMSLVGPRPVIRAELPLYKHLLGSYLAATPGLSGLWQVSGRSNVSFSERAHLDFTYVRNWSLTKDLAILLRTVPAVLRRVGAR